jgi:hypothetical protein
MLERSNSMLEVCRDLINGANCHDANLALLYLGNDPRGLPERVNNSLATSEQLGLSSFHRLS